MLINCISVEHKVSSSGDAMLLLCWSGRVLMSGEQQQVFIHECVKGVKLLLSACIPHLHVFQLCLVGAVSLPYSFFCLWSFSSLHHWYIFVFSWLWKTYIFKDVQNKMLYQSTKTIERVLQRIQSSLGELWNKPHLITVQEEKCYCNVSCINTRGVIKQMLMVVVLTL